MSVKFECAAAGLVDASIDDVAELFKKRTPSDLKALENKKAGEALHALQKSGVLTPAMLAMRMPDGSAIFGNMTDGDEYGDAVQRLEALFSQIPESKERRKVLHKLRRWLDVERRRMAENQQQVEHQLERLRRIERTIVDLADFTKRQDLALERPAASAIPDLLHQIKAGRAFSVPQVVVDEAIVNANAQLYIPLLEGGMRFLIEHDWAGAFAGATDVTGADYAAEGELKLPADTCLFEFRISGRPVIAVVTEADGCLMLEPITWTQSGWLLNGFVRRRAYGWESDGASSTEVNSDQLLKLVTSQVTAILVALDAEVAVAEAVRAPHRANHPIKRGDLPKYSYHVVRLSRRPRSAPLPAGHEVASGRRHRWHFRRGHWRHYPTHKTWIHWMLVGDPDLGFVDKHYRL